MASLEANITKVEKDESTGWYTIRTDDDEIKKLATKQEKPAKEAAALRRDGVRAAITYTLREKPREDGGVFKNYYLDKAEAAVASNGSDDGIEVVRQEQAPSRKTDPQDAWRMCLNKGGELAVLTMPLMPVEQRDFDTQKRLAVAWARFFFFSPLPDRAEMAFTAAPAAAHPGAYDEPGNYDPPPPTDEDIPFMPTSMSSNV
jgi:hypothetical protein